MIPRELEYHPYWYYHQYNTNVTAPFVTQFFSPRKGFNYLLEKIYIQFPAIGAAAPTAFSALTFTAKWYSPDGELNQVPLPVNCFTTPAAFDNFAGAGIQLNQAWLGGKKVFQPVPVFGKWQIQLGGYLGAANPLAVDVLIVGKNYAQ